MSGAEGAWTPTTKQVRDAFIEYHVTHRELYRAMFDRWLDEHVAAAVSAEKVRP